MNPESDLLCTLADLQRLAKEEFGARAPSYPTMKRWAKDGRLEVAQLREGRGRALYQRSLALSVLGQYVRRAEPPGRGQVPDPLPSPPNAAEPVASARIAAEVRELRAKVEELTEAVVRIARHTEDLSEARKMLMVKTDNEITLWRNRALAAEAAAQRLQGHALSEARSRRIYPSGVADYEPD